MLIVSNRPLLLFVAGSYNNFFSSPSFLFFFQTSWTGVNTDFINARLRFYWCFFFFSRACPGQTASCSEVYLSLPIAFYRKIFTYPLTKFRDTFHMYLFCKQHSSVARLKGGTLVELYTLSNSSDCVNYLCYESRQSSIYVLNLLFWFSPVIF